MKRLILITLTATVSLGGGAVEALAVDGVQFKTPQTAGSAATEQLIQRAAEAILGYARSCDNDDAGALDAVLTEDAVLEYPADDAGVYMSVDAIAAGSCWAGTQGIRSKSGRSEFWIYPALDQSVFVQYTVDREAGSPNKSAHLALVQMNGERIQRIRDFSAN